MTYMISNFQVSSTTKMGLIQALASQTFSASAGTYTISMGSITQSSGFGLTLSAGSVVLPAGEYVAFLRPSLRLTGASSNAFSFTVTLLLDGVIVSQLPAISEMIISSVSQDSSVPLGGARFTASANQVLSMSLTKDSTLATAETFASYTGIILIRM